MLFLFLHRDSDRRARLNMAKQNDAASRTSADNYCSILLQDKDFSGDSNAFKSQNNREIQKSLESNNGRVLDSNTVHIC